MAPDEQQLLDFVDEFFASSKPKPHQHRQARATSAPVPRERPFLLPGTSDGGKRLRLIPKWREDDADALFYLKAVTIVIRRKAEEFERILGDTKFDDGFVATLVAEDSIQTIRNLSTELCSRLEGLKEATK